MADAARGTVTGNLVIAVAEGLLIGAAYVMAGVPKPVLYSLLTIDRYDTARGLSRFCAAALLLVLEGRRRLAAAAVVVSGAA